MSGETETEVSAWTVDSLRSHVEALLQERDIRYEQRHQAIEAMVTTALATINKEFADRVDQVRNETVLAMAAAEKAIAKAENATEKRFDAVNEFRAQQGDLIQTFARKTEVDSRLVGLAEKVDAVKGECVALGGSTMPRNEYDRAHTDLAERVIQTERSLNEKIEAQAKAFEGRLLGLQAQLSSIQAITG